MVWTPGRVFVLAGAFLGFLGIGILLITPYDTPALPYVLAAEKRVEVDSKTSKAVVVYEVMNRGDYDLVFQKTISSCGCSVASIEPGIVKPGHTATISVQASVPAAGERNVAITVFTNSPLTPHFELKLTLVGQAEVPFIAKAPHRQSTENVEPWKSVDITN